MAARHAAQVTCTVLAAAVLVAAAVMAPAAAEMAPSTAPECNAGKLFVCAPAIIGGVTPSASCCTILQAQQGCFCQYAKDPAYAGFVNSPVARKAITSCGIPLPECQADAPSA